MGTGGRGGARARGALGNAPAHKLFELVRVERQNGADGPARGFADYRLTVNREAAPTGIEVVELL